jgi:hypothetical protein
VDPSIDSISRVWSCEDEHDAPAVPLLELVRLERSAARGLEVAPVAPDWMAASNWFINAAEQALVEHDVGLAAAAADSWL